MQQARALSSWHNDSRCRRHAHTYVSISSCTYVRSGGRIAHWRRTPSAAGGAVAVPLVPLGLRMIESPFRNRSYPFPVNNPVRAAAAPRMARTRPSRRGPRPLLGRGVARIARPRSRCRSRARCHRSLESETKWHKKKRSDTSGQIG